MPEVKTFEIGDAEGVVRGPLAVYPLASFKDFFCLLEQRFGGLELTTTGCFLPEEADKIRSLRGKGDFVSLAQLLDERDPASWKTNMVVEFPDGERYIFAKLLDVDNKPSYLTLNVPNNGRKQSRLEGMAEGAIFDILPKRAGVPQGRLGEVAEKYNIPREGLFDPGYIGNFNLGFVGMLDAVFEWLKAAHPKAYNEIFEKKELVVGDIGCGNMIYGNPLAYYFSVIHGKNTKLVAIDPDDSNVTGLDSAVSFFDRKYFQNARLIPIPRCLEDSPPFLEEEGIKQFDLLTMFNPRDVIDIGGLPEAYRARAPVLVVLDSSLGAKKEEMAENLVGSGYSVLLLAHNPFYDDMRRLFYSYTPIILSKPTLSLVKG